MLLKKWEELPNMFQNDGVKKYYDAISKKNASLIFKRIFDVFLSFFFVLIFSPVYIILGILIVIDSGFPIIYKQPRITQFGKEFKVFKFRTMVKNADKIGTLVTVENDSRITKIGKFLRKFRLDELPQAFNVLWGSMTFVGTRPEVRKYVSAYNDEMLATLLLPAGITSLASIKFKDENEMLKNSIDADREYIDNVLPLKMEYNLKYLKNFSFFGDLSIILKTILAIFK